MLPKKKEFYSFKILVALSNKAVSDYLNRIERLRDPSHVQDLSEEEWINNFENNNCEILKIETKAKMWPLTCWTNQMITPVENINEIKQLLEAHYLSFSEFIDIRKNEQYNEKGLFILVISIF